MESNDSDEDVARDLATLLARLHPSAYTEYSDKMCIVYSMNEQDGFYTGKVLFAVGGIDGQHVTPFYACVREETIDLVPFSHVVG